MSLGITERLRVVIELEGDTRYKRQIESLEGAERALARQTKGVSTEISRQGQGFKGSAAYAQIYQRELDGVATASRRVNNSVSGSGGLNDGLGGMSKLLTLGVAVAATRATYSLTKTGAQVQDLEESFRVLGGSDGVLEQARRALNYTVSDEAILRMFNQGRAFKLTNEQIASMLPLAKRAAKVMGRDVAESVNRVSQAIAKQETEFLDEIGITVTLTEAYKSWAVQNNVTVEAMSGTQKATALLNVALQKHNETLGQISTTAAADPLHRMGASFDNLIASAGKGTGIFRSFAEVSADAFDSMTATLEQERTIIEALESPLSAAGRSLTNLTAHTAELRREQQRLRAAMSLSMDGGEIERLRDRIYMLGEEIRQSNAGVIAGLREQQQQLVAADAAAQQYGDSVAQERVAAALARVNQQLAEAGGLGAVFANTVDDWSPLIEGASSRLSTAFTHTASLADAGLRFKRVISETVPELGSVVRLLQDAAGVGGGVLGAFDKIDRRGAVEAYRTQIRKQARERDLMNEARRLEGLPPIGTKRARKKRRRPEDLPFIDPAAFADELLGGRGSKLFNGLIDAARETQLQDRVRQLDREVQAHQEEMARKRDQEIFQRRRDEFSKGQGLAGQFGAFGGLFAEGPDQLNGFRDELGKTLDAMSMFAQTGNQAMMSFSQGVGQAVASSIVEGERLDRALGQMMGSVLINTGTMMLGQATAIAAFGAASAFFPVLGLPLGASAGGAAAALAAGGVGAIAAGAALGGGGRGRGRGRTGRGGGGGGGYGGDVPSIPRSRQREAAPQITIQVGLGTGRITDALVVESRDRQGSLNDPYLVVQEV